MNDIPNQPMKTEASSVEQFRNQWPSCRTVFQGPEAEDVKGVEVRNGPSKAQAADGVSNAGEASRVECAVSVGRRDSRERPAHVCWGPPTMCSHGEPWGKCKDRRHRKHHAWPHSGEEVKPPAG